MAKAKAGPISNGRVKSFIERVERLEEERGAIGTDIRDVYAEAKGVGYDVKTLRWMVQERKVDAADRAERDALREMYASALSMAVELVRVEGLSLRQAEEITGASKSSIQRALAVPELSQDHRDMTEDDLGDYLMLVSIEEDRIQASEIMYETLRGSREMVADDLGDPLWVIDKPRAQFREKVRAVAASVKTSPLGPVLSNAPPDDDLEFPAFLDRRRQVTA